MITFGRNFQSQKMGPTFQGQKEDPQVKVIVNQIAALEKDILSTSKEPEGSRTFKIKDLKTVTQPIVPFKEKLQDFQGSPAEDIISRVVDSLQRLHTQGREKGILITFNTIPDILKNITYNITSPEQQELLAKKLLKRQA